MLEPGDEVPDFQLPAGTGAKVDSRELRGRRWVIFFYPKDNTPGCATEVGEFGRARAEFLRRGVEVMGCSVGDATTKAQFATSCGAPDLPLLADEDHRVAEHFGAWTGSGDGGRLARTSFLVDAEGRVESVWEAVKPAGHAQAVLRALA